MRFTSIHLALWLAGLLVGLSGQRALAQVTAPSQGGGVNVVRVTATTMELKFGTNGTGQGRLVAIAVTKSGMPVPLSIEDGQRYQAATTYGKGEPVGKGYVVYNGKDYNATITGLQPNTYYYIMNAEYNADSTSILYNARGTSIATATKEASPLPVELVSFKGTLDKYNKATLQWATASERNTDYFALERSSNGSVFTEISTVPSAKNSTNLTKYQWSDPESITHPTYYRLRQVDLNGAAYYSSIVTLFPSSVQLRTIEVYPNPSTSQTIQILAQGFEGENLILHLMDTMGRLVASSSIAPTATSYRIPLMLPSEMTSGTYILKVYASDYTTQKRVIISN